MPAYRRALGERMLEHETELASPGNAKIAIAADAVVQVNE